MMHQPSNNSKIYPPTNLSPQRASSREYCQVQKKFAMTHYLELHVSATLLSSFTSTFFHLEVLPFFLLPFPLEACQVQKVSPKKPNPQRLSISNYHPLPFFSSIFTSFQRQPLRTSRPPPIPSSRPRTSGPIRGMISFYRRCHQCRNPKHKLPPPLPPFMR